MASINMRLKLNQEDLDLLVEKIKDRFEGKKLTRRTKKKVRKMIQTEFKNVKIIRELT